MTFIASDINGTSSEVDTRPEDRVLVREPNAAGPCIVLGLFVKRTEKFIMYREWRGGNRFADKVSRVGGWKVEAREGRADSYVHTTPCSCCRDHAQTQYPNGYDN